MTIKKTGENKSMDSAVGLMERKKKTKQSVSIITELTALRIELKWSSLDEARKQKIIR
jgi:hypothetical protein